jgi:hypothetical protein
LSCSEGLLGLRDLVGARWRGSLDCKSGRPRFVNKAVLYHRGCGPVSNSKHFPPSALLIRVLSTPVASLCNSTGPFLFSSKHHDIGAYARMLSFRSSPLPFWDHNSCLTAIATLPILIDAPRTPCHLMLLDPNCTFCLLVTDCVIRVWKIQMAISPLLRQNHHSDDSPRAAIPFDCLL